MRDKRRVYLTPAGHELLGRARLVLEATVQAKAAARSAASGVIGRPALAFTASSMFTERLPGAISSTESDVIGDHLRFMLLTGCRSIEAKGGKRKNIEYGKGLLVGDVDLVAQRLKLKDSKNRSDHEILLSKQALEIV